MKKVSTLCTLGMFLWFMCTTEILASDPMIKLKNQFTPPTQEQLYKDFISILLSKDIIEAIKENYDVTDNNVGFHYVQDSRIEIRERFGHEKPFEVLIKIKPKISNHNGTFRDLKGFDVITFYVNPYFLRSDVSHNAIQLINYEHRE